MDTTQLLKGVLDLAVLAVLAEEDGYGYAVVRPHRKYYGLNASGRDQLESSTKSWTTFSDTLDGLLARAGKEDAA
jgi:PadR family transcriptional regulator PadR